MAVALPLVMVPVPMDVVPNRKVTVPVGEPAPGAAGVTVAETVTGAPEADGLVGGVMVVVVAALLTTWERAVDVLPVKLVFPL